MKPVEFILWMNGATGVIGDEPPTPEQWAAIKEKLGEAVGGIVSSKLLEKAEEVMHNEEREKKQYAEKMRLEKEMRDHYHNSLRAYVNNSAEQPDPRADLLNGPFLGDNK